MKVAKRSGRREGRGSPAQLFDRDGKCRIPDIVSVPAMRFNECAGAPPNRTHVPVTVCRHRPAAFWPAERKVHTSSIRRVV